MGRYAVVVGLLLMVHAVPAVADRRAGAAVTVVHVPRGPVPSLGPRFAPVTVEFFVSFSGERTDSKFFEQLLDLTRRHPRRLRVEFHIVGDDRAEAAYEAFRQGKFFAFAKAALRDRGRHTYQAIHEWARAAELDIAQLDRALRTGRHKPEVARATALRARRTHGAQGSQRLVFNGVVPPRALSSLEEFEDEYDRHYGHARTLLHDGVALPRLFPRLIREAQDRALEQKPPETPFAVDHTPHRDPPPVQEAQLLTRPLSTGAFPSRGPEHAPVVLTALCSVQSGNCSNYYRRLRTVQSYYPSQVQFSLLPLFDDELHPDARLAHEATLCAHEQGQYWEFLNSLFGAFRQTQLTPEHLSKHALRIGIDMAEFGQCVASRRHRDAVDASLSRAHELGLVYSPSLIVGGRVYIGLRQIGDLMAIISAELRPGMLERAADLRRNVLRQLAGAAESGSGAKLQAQPRERTERSPRKFRRAL
jgi:protein-disulfide isomerase